MIFDSIIVVLGFPAIILLPLSFFSLIITLIIGLLKKDFKYFKINLKIIAICLILILVVAILWGISKIFIS